MRRITLMALLLASAGVIATNAYAQRYPGNQDPYYGRDPYYGSRDRDPYYGSRDRDPYNNGSYGYRGGDPVDRAIQNLQSAASMGRYDRHERDHFDRAIRELYKFQERRRSGRFDRGALDKAIDNMANLARADQLHPRSRSLIARDLSELRSFREYGGRGDPYYGNRRDPYSRW